MCATRVQLYIFFLLGHPSVSILQQDSSYMEEGNSIRPTGPQKVPLWQKLRIKCHVYVQRQEGDGETIKFKSNFDGDSPQILILLRKRFIVCPTICKYDNIKSRQMNTVHVVFHFMKRLQINNKILKTALQILAVLVVRHTRV